MRTFFRAAVVVIGITVVLGACAKAATGPSVTCGTGTHDDGAGTCQLDNALTLNNIVGSNYWACPDLGDRGFYYFYLSISSSGSGTIWNPAQTVQTTDRVPSRSDVISAANAYPHYTISWQEGAAQDQITSTNNPYFDTLKQIVPSSPVGAQSFTANAYLSGVLKYNLSCQLTLGTF